MKLKAIFLGCLVDFGGSLLVTGVLTLVAMSIFKGRGLSDQEVLALLATNPALLGSLVVGFIFSFLGGYVTGRVAKINELANVTVIIVIGIALTWAQSKYAPMWFSVLAILTGASALVLGALQAKRKNAALAV